MTIQEAINTGEPFRRHIPTTSYKPGQPPKQLNLWPWMIVVYGLLGRQFHVIEFVWPNRTEPVMFNVDDILADDWEIREET